MWRSNRWFPPWYTYILLRCTSYSHFHIYRSYGTRKVWIRIQYEVYGQEWCHQCCGVARLVCLTLACTYSYLEVCSDLYVARGCWQRLKCLTFHHCGCFVMDIRCDTSAPYCYQCCGTVSFWMMIDTGVINIQTSMIPCCWSCFLSFIYFYLQNIWLL